MPKRKVPSMIAMAMEDAHQRMRFREDIRTALMSRTGLPGEGYLNAARSVAASRPNDPVMFAAAERVHRASARPPMAEYEPEFDHVLGQHIRESTQTPSGVIREYIPRNPKQWPIWNKPGDEFVSEMEDVRTNPHGLWGENI